MREQQLSNLKTIQTHLTIARGKLKATLRKDGKKIWSSRIGIGKAGTETPAGRFWIRERLSNLRGSPVYGPWAFGTSAYSATLTDWPGGGVIGIHGTNQPELIPGRPSHGCIRVPERGDQQAGQADADRHADPHQVEETERRSRLPQYEGRSPVKPDMDVWHVDQNAVRMTGGALQLIAGARDASPGPVMTEP